MNNLRKIILAILVIISTWQVVGQEANAIFNTAKSLVLEQNYSEALSKYKDAFATEIGDSVQLAEAYGYAGICLEETGNVREALKHYKKALNYKVLELSIYDKAISLTKEMKNHEMHEWALMEKVKYFPEFKVDVEKALSSHYLKTKQYDKLLISSEKMGQWFPDSPKYKYYMGVAYQSQGDIDQAVEAYKLALDKDAEYTSANMRLGHILFEKGNKVYAKKKKAYEAIAKPTRVDYSNYHKSLEEAKVIYREAEGYLLKAYQVKQDPNLKKMLYAVYTRLGEKEKALKFK
ncbi:tetratricopeptide repeat protein [Saccharicrinis sp. GN24d3]|uniref:tetratricopeptide repeat protein n=1 Tax=Saccharicrinis sp. GN24d3 TaxID=3458416 RepID=UPI0040353AB8